MYEITKSQTLKEFFFCFLFLDVFWPNHGAHFTCFHHIKKMKHCDNMTKVGWYGAAHERVNTNERFVVQSTVEYTKENEEKNYHQFIAVDNHISHEFKLLVINIWSNEIFSLLNHAYHIAIFDFYYHLTFSLETTRQQIFSRFVYHESFRYRLTRIVQEEESNGNLFISELELWLSSSIFACDFSSFINLIV